MKKTQEKLRNIILPSGVTHECWTVCSDDLLRDLKFLLKDYYVATFDQEGKSLSVKFNNGQTFRFTVEEAL